MTSQTLPDIELLSIPTEPGHNDSVSDREAVVRRALVVDDSPKILEMFSSILTSWGYDVLTASDGAEAWHMMQKMDIPLVVLDWHMPEMSGIELCEAIRRKFGAQSRYLILITAEITKDSYKDFLTAGIDDYIRKPLDPISIHAAVRMAERIQSLNQRLIRETAELEEMRRRRLDVHVERLEMDINAAATYQQSDFPALSDRLGDLQFETVFHPASTISGDTFNYFTTDSTWTNFYSIDVAGHGMASGLLAVTLNTILRDGSCAYRFTEDGVFNIEGKKISTPAELCADLNETFQTDGLTRPYFTMVAGSYNRHQRLMRVCLAGHPPPVIIKKSGEAIFVGDSGYPIGLIETAEFEDSIFELEPGDRFVAVTDGIIEAEGGPQNMQFGYERMVACLASAQGRPLTEMIGTLEEKVRSWRGDEKQADDITILSFECME